MVGITVITAALVILLSAFNGIEKMIESLYSDFDTSITIRKKESKTFKKGEVELENLQNIDGVQYVSAIVEETVVLKHEEKWVNAQLRGVDSNFILMTKMGSHMVDGFPALQNNGKSSGIIGATLLDKLEGFIPRGYGTETIFIYGPKRDMRIRLGRNPFRTQLIPIVGRFNYNREVNAEMLVVPLQDAQDVLGYDSSEISAVYLSVFENKDKNKVKKIVQGKVGDGFDVKTNYEKNELIFKTSKSEKIIVLIILLFVFLLASFNLVASLTMLFIEKKENMLTLRSLGANAKHIFSIFFLEGLFIAGKGIVFGLVIGYGVCAAQIYFSILQMPNSNGESFPIALSFTDGLLIFTLVSTLSVLASYFPVKSLVRRNLPKED